MRTDNGSRPRVYNHWHPSTHTTAFVNAVELDNLVTEELPDLRWAYLERETGEQCVQLTSIDAAVPSDYTSGRAFSMDYELRWQAVGSDAFSLQLFSEQPANREDFVELPYDFDSVQPAPYSMLLMGTLAETLKEEHYWSGSRDLIWIETRVPRPLEYPMGEPVRQVSVLARDYCVNGIVVATRWLDLQGA